MLLDTLSLMGFKVLARLLAEPPSSTPSATPLPLGVGGEDAVQVVLGLVHVARPAPETAVGVDGLYPLLQVFLLRIVDLHRVALDLQHQGEVAVESD